MADAGETALWSVCGLAPAGHVAKAGEVAARNGDPQASAGDQGGGSRDLCKEWNRHRGPQQPSAHLHLPICRIYWPLVPQWEVPISISCLISCSSTNLNSQLLGRKGAKCLQALQQMALSCQPDMMKRTPLTSESAVYWQSAGRPSAFCAVADADAHTLRRYLRKIIRFHQQRS